MRSINITASVREWGGNVLYLCVFFFLLIFLGFFLQNETKKTQHLLISIQFPSRTTNRWSVVIQDMKGNNRRKQSQKITRLIAVVCQDSVCTSNSTHVSPSTSALHSLAQQHQSCQLVFLLLVRKKNQRGCSQYVQLRTGPGTTGSWGRNRFACVCAFWQGCWSQKRGLLLSCTRYSVQFQPDGTRDVFVPVKCYIQTGSPFPG